jgi:type III secretion protein V
MMRELLLPTGVLLIIGSMLLPLPPVLLDVLLIGNLILAFILFIGTVLISEPLKLSAFPTILLLVTLYRLALNISTTRLILSGESAGEAVQAFGEVVLGGNLFVGVVVFLIITLVQLIVVAKGAERVAEVSARFTLDALPGKQMSIDSDIRSGLMTVEEGRRKRQDLQMESRFYGALDGAMKFVKGDAIAGLIIIAINIVGGLALGVVSHGMTLYEALDHFTILTVGDGLLSQVPAFLNSLAAGVIVTRVARGDGASLATELPHQIAQVRYAGAFTLVLGFGLFFLVGLPALFFFIVPIVVVSLRLLLNSKQNKNEVPKEEFKFSVELPTAFHLNLPPSLLRVASTAVFIRESIEKVRQDMFDAMGILVEAPSINQGTESGSLEVYVYRTKVLSLNLDSGWEETFYDCLRRCLYSFRIELLTDVHTRRLLEFYERKYPEVINQVVPDVVAVTPLTQILKRLLREEVPIRNFILILQTLAEGVTEGRRVDTLLEEVRVTLRREIYTPLLKEEKLHCFVLNPEIDTTLSMSVSSQQQIDGKQLDLILYDLREKNDEGFPVVCSRQTRCMLSQFLFSRGATCRILAYDEVLGAELVVQGELPAMEDRVVEQEREEDYVAAY